MNLKTLGGCKPKPAPYRFHKSYKKDSSTGCWVWQGKSKRGSKRLYGQIKVNGRPESAHRYAWELHNSKKIPKGLIVMHKCDNPPCVNPDHLRVGTLSDNMQDMIKKGRAPVLDHPRAKGSNNGNSKLNDELAMEIYKSSKTQRFIAKEFQISQATVFHIKSKRTWRHIHGGL